MNAATVLIGGAGLAVVVWVLAKLGRAFAAIAETLAALAFLGLALWGLVRVGGWIVRQLATHWRTCLAVLALGVWWHWLGWPSLAITAGSVGLVALVWRLGWPVGFEQWCGRWVRGWWLRWAVYGRKLPGWLHACGLTVRDEAIPVDVTVNLVSRRRKREAVAQSRRDAGAAFPKLLRVRSGPSWDEVRVRLVPGQTPEDFGEGGSPG